MLCREPNSYRAWLTRTSHASQTSRVRQLGALVVHGALSWLKCSSGGTALAEPGAGAAALAEPGAEAADAAASAQVMTIPLGPFRCQSNSGCLWPPAAGILARLRPYEPDGEDAPAFNHCAGMPGGSRVGFGGSGGGGPGGGGGATGGGGTGGGGGGHAVAACGLHVITHDRAQPSSPRSLRP